MRTEIQRHPFRLLAIVVAAFAAFVAAYALGAVPAHLPGNRPTPAATATATDVPDNLPPVQRQDHATPPPPVNRDTAPVRVPQKRVTIGGAPPAVKAQPRPAVATKPPATRTPEPARSTTVATPSVRGTCGPLNDQPCTG